MSKLTREQVEHIAQLARLELSDDEKVKFADQLSSILQYVEKLQSLDTGGVEPMAHVLDLKNVTRDDQVAPVPHMRDTLLSDMPAREGDLLKVPPVFER